MENRPLRQMASMRESAAEGANNAHACISHNSRHLCNNRILLGESAAYVAPDGDQLPGFHRQIPPVSSLQPQSSGPPSLRAKPEDRLR